MVSITTPYREQRKSLRLGPVSDKYRVVRRRATELLAQAFADLCRNWSYPGLISDLGVPGGCEKANSPTP